MAALLRGGARVASFERARLVKREADWVRKSGALECPLSGREFPVVELACGPDLTPRALPPERCPSMTNSRAAVMMLDGETIYRPWSRG